MKGAKIQEYYESGYLYFLLKKVPDLYLSMWQLSYICQCDNCQFYSNQHDSYSWLIMSKITVSLNLNCLITVNMSCQINININVTPVKLNYGTVTVFKLMYINKTAVKFTYAYLTAVLFIYDNVTTVRII